MTTVTIDPADTVTLIATYRQLLVQAENFDRADQPTEAANRRGIAEGIATAANMFIPFTALVDAARLSEIKPGYTIVSSCPVTLDEAVNLIEMMEHDSQKMNVDGARLRELMSDERWGPMRVFSDKNGPGINFPEGGLAFSTWRPS
jgi:hypothetical protein